MITTTEKSALKKKMLEACIARQDSLITDFKDRIKSLLETGQLGNEEAYDNNELAQRAQTSEEVDALNTALKFAVEEMEFLRRLSSTLNDPFTHVVPGAVVVTTLNTFFVSVSIEQFRVDDQTYIGLSAKSPLYQAMKGKQQGQKFTFKGITYKITDVY